MIQNKLKEAYPTPLQLRNATKELQNNMEISNEVYIEVNWDLTQDYTSPDKSIVYTASNKTITFNMDIGFKLNVLNYIHLYTSNDIDVSDLIIEFYSKNNSYNFIGLIRFVNQQSKTFYIRIEQEDNLSIYTYPNYIHNKVTSLSEGYIDIETESISYVIIKNIVLGKINGILFNPDKKHNFNYVCLDNNSNEV